ncbi:MAG: DUF547 domain-containing protein [Mariprofundaceae bacterium]
MIKFLMMAAVLLCSTLSYANESIWKDYADLLSEHVQVGVKNSVQTNLVDYNTWKEDERWPKVLKGMADFDLLTLHSKDEKLAFWINAYNMMAIEKVLKHWPVESIRDAGNFFNPVWKQPVVMIAGQMRSLDEVEHHILHPMGEPLMHVAIVCASVSCPDLRTEPYHSEHLQDQLQDQAVQFLNREGKGLRVAADGLHLSKLFDWFEDDFSQGNVKLWLHKYRNDVQGNSHIASYLPYDWHVNAL